MAPFTFKADHQQKDLKERLKKTIFESDYMKFVEKEGTNCNLPWLKLVEVVEMEKLSETTARGVYRFPVTREYLNPTMTLHGGLSSSFFDTATTWTMMSIARPGFWSMGGISRSLNVVFLRPAQEGEMLRMETEVVHAGKTLCLIKAVLMRESDRAIISTCEHQKYNIDPPVSKM